LTQLDGGAVLHLIKALFVPLQPGPAVHQPSAGGNTKAGSPNSEGTASRKQLLAVVLKETLLRNQVPTGCLRMEFFRTLDKAGARSQGIHVRLAVREWHPNLPARMLPLERDFRRRLGLLDYRAAEWLQGITWQFDVADDMPLTDSVDAGTSVPAAARVTLRPRAAEERAFAGATYAYTEPAPL
jgi:hypothetical protein